MKDSGFQSIFEIIGKYVKPMKENTLKYIQCRIKGSKLYDYTYTSRLYIPYTIDYYPNKVRIKIFFEIVNDKLQLFVDVLSDDFTSAWCKLEAEHIRSMMSDQFYELINNCEAQRRTIPLHIRLNDTTKPFFKEASPQEERAIRFLCSMKVSALIGESQCQRWFIAIRLIQSRYNSNKIRKLHILLPHSAIKAFKQVLYAYLGYLTIPVLITSIESLSHNMCKYLKLQDYIDSTTMLIVDNCHLFKNPEAIRTRRLLELAGKCNYKLIMTDSLIVNNIHDIYAQYRILSNLIMGYYRWGDFARNHIIYGGFGGDQILGYKNLAHLANITEAYTYGIDKPKRRSASIWIKTYICELTYRQKYYYQQKKDQLLALIENHEIQLTDIFSIMTQMQKIVCGYIPDSKGGQKIEKINKLSLLREYGGKNRCIILCKYLFEIDLLKEFLGEASCAVLSGRNRNKWQLEKESFESGQKQYLIVSLSISDPDLEEKRMCGFCEIIFFSLSFKYLEYMHCLNFIKESRLNDCVCVKRFTTNSGIDRKIIENLKRKGKLVDEVNGMYNNKTELKRLVKYL